MSDVDALCEAEAKKELVALQKKYGALIVNFNNQQAELAAVLKRCAAADDADERGGEDGSGRRS